ncbi:MAG: efflux RND transporter periplasmic adaptor subunit [Nitrospiraceae bacterium]|nr:MAG: efflux RND transporter periplasmic adaptor subunit [Nitrospiraceae bacterium]
MAKKIFIGLTILSIFTMAGCGEKIKPGESEVIRPQVSGVGIEEAVSSEVTDYYETSGTLKSVDTVLLSAKIMGEVREIKVKPGDKVRKGDVLLIISAPDINARVQAAQEALEEAKQGLDMAGENKNLMEKTFERYSKLFNEKAVSEQEFDEIKARREVAALEYERSKKALNRAEAGLNEAQAYRDYSIIKSPLDGTVAEKRIEAGNMAVPGAPLILVESPSYRVETPVDETLLPLIETGASVAVSIDAINMDTTGRVTEIVRQTDPLTRTFMVKISINDTSKSLQGGFYAKVTFPLGKKTALSVPEGAIVTKGELKGVYTVNQQGIITLRLVKTGKQHDGMVEILTGLSSGERIIVKGADRAVDGGKIADEG